MLSQYAVIALCIGMAYGATWIGYTPMKPREFADKEGCYVKEINDVIPFGGSVSPIGVCYSISCGKSMMDYASCGVVGTEDRNCHVTKQDLNKPYPDCCQGIKCDLENTID